MQVSAIFSITGGLNVRAKTSVAPTSPGKTPSWFRIQKVPDSSSRRNKAVVILSSANCRSAFE
eukprot:6405869-Pyramimonas_sp.AAC.1